MNATTRSDVEAALLARGAVRRGRHVRFSCVAHADSRPSADFDPAKGAWICRSCGVGGGIRDLARRLGLDVAPARRPRQAVRVPPPPDGIDRESWAEAWQKTVAKAKAEDRRAAGYRAAGPLIDLVRHRIQLVATARRTVSSLGDTEAAWRLADHAARIETATRVMEAALDGA